MGKPGRIKLPVAWSSTHIQAPSVATGPTDHLTPVFCLRLLQKKHDLEGCELEERASLAMTFHKLCQSTWRQLYERGRHRGGYEKIARSAIRAGIPPEVTEDVEFFIAFRFSGLKPMVGYRSGNVFHVVWLDRDFRLYDH